MAKVKLCPICLTESVGGKPHGWHKSAHRKKRYSVEMLSDMARAAIEANQIKAIICEAVDLARQPDDVKPRVHRVRIRRKPKAPKVSHEMRKRLRPLISGLCRAVDLGRISARW